MNMRVLVLLLLSLNSNFLLCIDHSIKKRKLEIYDDNESNKKQLLSLINEDSKDCDLSLGKIKENIESHGINYIIDNFGCTALLYVSKYVLDNQFLINRKNQSEIYINFIYWLLSNNANIDIKNQENKTFHDYLAHPENIILHKGWKKYLCSISKFPQDILSIVLDYIPNCYGCSLCTESFLDTSALGVHIFNNHECGYCGARFDYKKELDNHIAHSNNSHSACREEFPEIM